jgi:hypothetical protein
MYLITIDLTDDFETPLETPHHVPPTILFGFATFQLLNGL